MTLTEHPLKGQLAETMAILLGTVEHLPMLGELLDQYRVFYGQPSDRPAAEHFLFERLINHESLIYLALDQSKEQAAGFIQLYPTFSSVSLMPEWLLSDLYVHPAYRRQGIATALLGEAMQMVKQREDKGLRLEMLPENIPAQKLYESLGFVKNTQWLQYAWRNG
jgi:ribosomal protein S18 acetylase RimI-like enzyme